MKKIKDMVALSGLSRRTLQYYDDTGLMDVKRTAENYRIFEEEDIWRIWEIIIYKEMGFQLSEIGKLLTAEEEDLQTFLQARVNAVENEMSELSKVHDFIKSVVAHGMPHVDLETLIADGQTMVDLAKKMTGGK